MSKLRAAVRVEAERSSISAIPGPDLVSCQFVASTLQLLMATSVRYACHLQSCLLWPSLFLPSLMFKYSLHLWCSFGVAVSSFTIPPGAQNASLCFAVRQTACTAEGIIPTLKLN